MFEIVRSLSLKRISNALHAAGEQALCPQPRGQPHRCEGVARGTQRIVETVKRGTLVRALKATKAFGSGAFTIRSKGGDIGLKFFRRARPARVSAPWNAAYYRRS